MEEKWGNVLKVPCVYMRQREREDDEEEEIEKKNGGEEGEKEE